MINENKENINLNKVLYNIHKFSNFWNGYTSSLKV